MPPLAFPYAALRMNDDHDTATERGEGRRAEFLFLSGQEQQREI